jgi:hypothetical protein
MACYGAYCGACGCPSINGEPYSDDADPELKLAAALRLGAVTIDEALWEIDR